jgi:alpha,alpha-trehalase
MESLRKFETEGGLVSGTEESRGRISIDRPNRQWGTSTLEIHIVCTVLIPLYIVCLDYPYGWAPHQIMTWVGMERYGYQEDAQRLAYRWIFM